jgi:hypothetical protein
VVSVVGKGDMGQAPDIGSIVCLVPSLILPKHYPNIYHHRIDMGSENTTVYLVDLHTCFIRSRPGPLADRQVTGTISRLAPQQATLTIQISNSKPVPESNEDFTGVIRLADIRLTERDKIKMGDCFRLGDLVRAKVVRFLLFFFSFFLLLFPSFVGPLFGGNGACLDGFIALMLGGW